MIFFEQLSQLEVNESLTEENIKDEDYMFVDDLQKLTDEYVIEVNSSLTPKIIWRPFIEILFKDVVTLDLSGRDKVLVGNLEYLKDLALIIASRNEEDFGIFSNSFLKNKFIYYIIRYAYILYTHTYIINLKR